MVNGELILPQRSLYRAYQWLSGVEAEMQE
jgi:hypothetical protein